MSALLDKLKKAGSVSASSILSKSVFFASKDMTKTDLPILNIALSGETFGGFTSGITLFAGQSRVFKSNLCLYALKAYLNKYPEGIALFYDCEFGTPTAYMESMGIDTERVIHIPITNIEELTFDLTKRLEEIERGDKVFVLIDSIGNLASKREYENAINENSAKDMSRAQALKGFFRVITPHVTMKDIPLFGVAHVYQETGCLSPDTIVMTNNGPVKISNVKIDDYVVTPIGYKKVTDVIGPDRIPIEDKEYYKITLDSGKEIYATGNHKFLIGNKWIRCDEIKCGDNMSPM